MHVCQRRTAFAALLMMFQLGADVSAAPGPASVRLPAVARPTFAASAAQIVDSGPAALEPAEIIRQEQYLQLLGRRLLAHPEPRAWMLASHLLSGTQAVAVAAPGGATIPISSDVEGDEKAATAAAERTRRTGLGDPVALLMLLANWVPSAFALDGAQVARRLSEVAPQNAHSWLVLANVASASGDDDAVVDALRRASSAPVFDDYHGEIVRLMLSSSEAFPPPELRQRDGAYRSRTVERLILANLIAERTAARWTRSFVPMDCSGATPESMTGASCRSALMKVVSRPTTYASATRAWESMRNLTQGQMNREEVDRQLRGLAWQQEKLYELGFAIADIITEADASIGEWERGGTEVSVGIARLQRHHIALEPPSDWQPKPRAMVRVY